MNALSLHDVKNINISPIENRHTGQTTLGGGGFPYRIQKITIHFVEGSDFIIELYMYGRENQLFEDEDS